MTEQLHDAVALGGENRRPTIRSEVASFSVGFLCVLVMAPVAAVTSRSVIDVAGGIIGSIWVWPLLYRGAKWVGNRGD